MFKHILLIYLIIYMPHSPSSEDMLEFYIRQYDDTITLINILQNRLDRIQSCIDDIYFQDEYDEVESRYHRRMRQHQHSNSSNSNRFRNSLRNNSHTSRTIPNRNINRHNMNINSMNINSENTNILDRRPLHIDTNETIPVLQNVWNSFLTSVPIIPTNEQIENATRRIRYEDITNPLNESCPICLEQFTNEDTVTQIQHCGHIFNSQQLSLWFRSNVRCPVCRYDIRNYRTMEENTPVNTNANANTSINTNIVDRISDYFVNNDTSNIFDRIMYDVSNNMLLFETTLRYPTN